MTRKKFIAALIISHLPSVWLSWMLENGLPAFDITADEVKTTWREIVKAAIKQ